MTASCNLTTIEINPSTPAQHSMIWLHGLGADGHDFVPIASALQLPPTLSVRFIFPHAPLVPVTINQGMVMRAWYDIATLTFEGVMNHTGIMQAMVLVHALIEKEIARGVSSKRIMLAGFSQGAVMALATGLCYPQPLAGIVALSGYLPLPILQSAHDANRESPIFLAHGTQDMVVPYALGQAAYHALAQAAYPVTWHAYPMAHSVAETQITDLSSWIKAIWPINQK